jgi:hypothetical protein
MTLASISKTITSSIFVGHSIVMLVVSCAMLHCAFDIVCTLETLEPVPLMGRAPHAVHDALLLNFESGMMDNVTGAVFGYMPALLIATWALRRSHDWLALRLLVTVASVASMLIVSQIIVYFSIRHQVDNSAVALLIESSTPLTIVGLAAIWHGALLMRQKLPVRDEMWLVRSRKITAAKVLLGITGLFELCFAISNIVWPVGAGEIFLSLTGYHPSRLLSIGFSIPRSTATVVVGVALSQIILALSRRLHRHATLVLVPSVMMHVATVGSLTISVVGERRFRRLHDENRRAAVDVACAVIAFVSLLSILVVVAMCLVVATDHVAVEPEESVELRSWRHESSSGSVSDCADSAMQSESCSSMSNSNSNSTASTKSTLEPVPAHVRLIDSGAAECRLTAGHAFLTEEPVPSRSRLILVESL